MPIHNLIYSARTIHYKNEWSFQPFLGYLSCFCSYVSIMGHIQSIIINIHSLQCHILNILQYGSLPLLCINPYARGKLMSLGKYNATGVVHYHGTAPKAFISVVQCFGKGSGIVISLVHSTLPQQQDRFLILVSCYCSHTIANTINLHGELP